MVLSSASSSSSGFCPRPRPRPQEFGLDQHHCFFLKKHQGTALSDKMYSCIIFLLTARILSCSHNTEVSIEVRVAYFDFLLNIHFLNCTIFFSPEARWGSLQRPFRPHVCPRQIPGHATGRIGYGTITLHCAQTVIRHVTPVRFY